VEVAVVETSYQYIGRGIYSIPEASRLSGVNARSISRWIGGYRTSSHGGSFVGTAVLEADYEVINHHRSLSFLDLLEIRFVDAFRKHGVSWKTIRSAMGKACELLQERHPFSSKKFLTDGKDILYLVEQENRDPQLLNLLNDQYELQKLLEHCLHEGLEFTPDDIASRWWPRGQLHDVVIDPARSFGKPIVASAGVPTGILYASFLAESCSVDRVAHWFALSPAQVVEAVDFEKSLIA
jgi:DNA-binding transcriptional MerR regulator/uncharacterized protein (DUF433 family)